MSAQLQGGDLADRLAGVPLEMRCAPRWLLWKQEGGAPGKKPRKVPYYINGQRRGATDTPGDLARLATFDAAVAAVAKARAPYAGLGFALGKADDGLYWQGVDFDHIDKRPELLDLLDASPGGYRERSPSGCGFHLVGKGGGFAALGSNDTGVEAYCEGRYFTVTGVDACGSICDLADYVEGAVSAHHRQGRPTTTAAIIDLPVDDIPAPLRTDPGLIRQVRGALAYIDHDDRQVWVSVGQELRAGLGDDGWPLFQEYSRRSSKFDAADARRVWDSCRGERTGMGALFLRAKAGGFIMPATQARPRDPDRFKPRPVAELLAQPAPRWLVDGVIPLGGVSLLYGASRAGKSFAALELATAMVRGRPFFGKEVMHGPVAYIAAEGRGGIPTRLKGYLQRHGCEPADLDGLDVVLSAVNLAEGAGGEVQELAAELAEIRPVLVIIDTLSRCCPMDEDARAFNNVLASCAVLEEMTGATALLVHHKGKNEEAGARGSSALPAGVEATLRLDRPNQGDTRLLYVEKCRDGADEYALGAFTLPVIELGTDEHTGRVIATCVVDPCDAPDGPRAPGKKAPTQVGRVLLDVLNELLDDQEHARLARGDEIEAGASFGRRVVAQSEVREAFMKRQAEPAPGKSDPRRQAWKRACDDLQGKGWMQLHTPDQGEAVMWLA